MGDCASAEVVAKELWSRLSGGLEPVAFYWLAVSGPRSVFREELERRLADGPFLVQIVRDAHVLSDPNVVAQDLSAVVRESEGSVCDAEFREHAHRCGAVAYVLLAKREMEIAQTASPLKLPEWFPVRAGVEVTAAIKDLTWSASARLDSAELNIGGLREATYWVDLAMTEAVSAMAERNLGEVAAFGDRFLGESNPEAVVRWAQDTAAALRAISGVRGYRPSLRARKSMVSVVWSAVSRTAPDSLGKYGEALARAVGVGDSEAPNENLAYLVGRPTSPVKEGRPKWGVSVMQSCAAACQVSNASAHSDSYADYPVMTIKAVSKDLRAALWRVTERLNALHSLQ